MEELLTEVINVPVTREFKIKFIAICRALGFSEHTPVARSMLIKGYQKFLAATSEADRKKLDDYYADWINKNV
jgi:hypothetical protein